MNERHWNRLRPYIKDNKTLETVVKDYEYKPMQYLQRDLRLGKTYSLYISELRRERVVNVLEYAGKRGWL